MNGTHTYTVPNTQIQHAHTQRIRGRVAKTLIENVYKRIIRI